MGRELVEVSPSRQFWRVSGEVGWWLFQITGFFGLDLHLCLVRGRPSENTTWKLATGLNPKSAI